MRAPCLFLKNLPANPGFIDKRNRAQNQFEEDFLILDQKKIFFLCLQFLNMCIYVCAFVYVRTFIYAHTGFPGDNSGKESTCQWRRHKRLRFDPWVGKIPWKRKWQSAPVFLSRESFEQKSLVGYSSSWVGESRTRLSDEAHKHVHTHVLRHPWKTPIWFYRVADVPRAAKGQSVLKSPLDSLCQ